MLFDIINPQMFQHAAARRRLISYRRFSLIIRAVSTRSRPKAADLLLFPARKVRLGFNTQPPKGG